MQDVDESARVAQAEGLVDGHPLYSLDRNI